MPTNGAQRILFSHRGYLAPEFSNNVITYKFDLYSLGVIITEILNGKKGYQAVENVRVNITLFQDKRQIEDLHLKYFREIYTLTSHHLVQSYTFVDSKSA